jgi:hypothetical protein
MDGCRVDSHGLLGSDIRAVLQVVVLSLLLGLEVQTSQTAKIFLK